MVTCAVIQSYCTCGAPYESLFMSGSHQNYFDATKYNDFEPIYILEPCIEA